MSRSANRALLRSDLQQQSQSLLACGCFARQIRIIHKPTLTHLTTLVQRPLRVEKSRPAAARGEGRHVHDAGRNKELLDDLSESVDARGVELVLAVDLLDFDAFGEHLARVFNVRAGEVRDDSVRRPVVICAVIRMRKLFSSCRKTSKIGRRAIVVWTRSLTALPRERDIDGVARYCFQKIVRELLGAAIEPTAKPRFYYVKTATGG